MIKLNEYFGGNVKSFALANTEGNITVGVMKPGEYEFGTASVEHMTVVTGSMFVLLPKDSGWRQYKPFETFKVEKGIKFKVRIEEDTAYKCLYE